MKNRILLLFLLLFCTSFYSGDVNFKVKEVTTNKGLKFLFVENHDLPVVSLEIAFKNSGYAYDSKEKQGLAVFISSLLHEGAGENDVREFAKKLDNKGIRLSADVSREYFHVYLETLSENLSDAMSLLSDYLLKPHLNDDGFNRTQAMQAVLIKKLEEEPGFIARNGLDRLLFDQHPYANTKYGLIDTLKNITRDDTTQYVKKNFNQEGMIISIVGSVKSQELSELIDNYLSKLPLKSEEPVYKIENANVLTAGKNNHIFMDIPQSIVFFGQKGIAINDPNYYKAYLLNYALGGMGLNSVLMRELRDKLSLTYHSSTFLETNEHGNILGGVLYTDNSTASQAISAVKQVFSEVEKEGIDNQLFESTKTNIINSFVFSLSNNSNIVRYLTKIQLHNLEANYINNYTSYFKNIKPEDIKKVAHSLLSANDLLFFEVSKKNSLV